jgi:hypothetical protein
MLLRTGAVHAMAAPAPIRLIIFRLEMLSFGSSSSGLTDSPPPQVQQKSRIRTGVSSASHERVVIQKG